MRFLITPANLADNNQQILSYLFKGLTGKCYGDKGYLTSLLEELLEKEIHLISKVRRNMKNMLHSMQDKLNLLKRGSIEVVNDILMSVCDIDHSINSLISSKTYSPKSNKPSSFRSSSPSNVSNLLLLFR